VKQAKNLISLWAKAPVILDDESKEKATVLSALVESGFRVMVVLQALTPFSSSAC